MAHFENCKVSPGDSPIRVLGSARTLTKLLTLEVLFIRDFNPVMNTMEKHVNKMSGPDYCINELSSIG